MFKKILAAGVLLAAGITSVSAAPYGFFDARSVAMGNVSVATGGVQTAAFANPAMLSINEGDDSFALLIPAIGAQLIDDGDVVDLVDEFQDLENGPLSAASLQRQYDIANQLATSGATLTANGAVNAALVFSGDTFAIAGHYRGYGTATGSIINFNNNLSNPDADLRAFGYVAQEVGVSLATKLDLAGIDIAVGVRPKNVSLEAIDFQESITTVDSEDIADDSVQDLGSFTSMDAGIAINLLDSFTVGLLATNILDETKTTNNATPIDFETHLRAGISYHNSFITIAADMDLDEIEPTLYEDKSQMMAIGVELNAFDFMQIRAGYQTNMASGSTEPDLISAGLGFWLGFHLDVAVVAGDDSSMGAFLQTGFRF
jgi:hypothetical protein